MVQLQNTQPSKTAEVQVEYLQLSETEKSVQSGDEAILLLGGKGHTLKDRVASSWRVCQI